MKYIVAFGVIASMLLLIFSVAGIKKQIPQDKRDYMDPLSGGLRVIWPIVLFFTYFIGDRVSVDTLERYSRSLKRSGLSYMMAPEQFVGLRVTGLVLGAALGFVASMLLGEFNVYYVLVAALIGYVMPLMSVNDRKKKREKLIVKALPVYLDYLTMAVQAGMNMTGAIQQAVEKGPEGPLRTEFSKVLRDIRAGMSRMDAIRTMSERLDIREINAFSTSIAQAEKTGASVGATLKVQADQRRVERFQRAEKLAMEAPVKLIFPLVMFIFPMTFLALGFPIVMKFMYDV